MSFTHQRHTISLLYPNSIWSRASFFLVGWLYKYTDNTERRVDGAWQSGDGVKCGEACDWYTAFHQVLWSQALYTPVDHERDLVSDTIRNVQPVELSVHEINHSSTKDDIIHTKNVWL